MAVIGLSITAAVGGCRPSDVLSVPPPAGVLGNSALQNQTGAEAVFNGAKGQLFYAADGQPDGGLVAWSGVLTDEFTYDPSFSPAFTNTDARQTAAHGGYGEGADPAWTGLLQARSSLVSALVLLGKFEPPSGRSKIGEAYALMGYSELLIAEAYCAGTPLDQVVPGGGIQYGMPLTTDSLLSLAQAHFDSAVNDASGSDSVIGLASVGLGRTQMDRNQYAAAATAVQNVPTSFVYNTELVPTYSSTYAPNPWAMGVAYYYYRHIVVGDREGENGLDFVSAHDPRLLLDSSNTSAGGTTPWYLPLKFANLSLIPLATGIEARLIKAEAALSAGQTGTWLQDLNALRNSGCSVSGSDTVCSLGTGQVLSQTVGLPSLTDPGTDSGRVSLMFRERAFWLFGTGTRLGDLRRLIRQYGRPQNTVFPTGVYAEGTKPRLPAPIPDYGTDVSLTLPTPAGLSQSGGNITNPHYAGCISPTSTP